jgi:hypothetical protein
MKNSSSMKKNIVKKPIWILMASGIMKDLIATGGYMNSPWQISNNPSWYQKKYRSLDLLKCPLLKRIETQGSNMGNGFISLRYQTIRI